MREKLSNMLRTYMNRMSLNRKLKVFMYGVLTLCIGLILILMIIFVNFNHRYQSTLENVTASGQFNISGFKDNLDSKLYRIVIGASTFEEEEPYAEVESAMELVITLKNNASTAESKKSIERVEKFLNILTPRIKEIEDTYRILGNYDENETRLENNIKTLTALIQEQMSEYIYYEAVNLAELQKHMQSDINRTLTIFIAMFFLVVFIAWGMIRVLTDSVVKPIQALCENVKQIGEGDFSIRASTKEDNEIQTLSRRFNRMAERIGGLIEDIKVEQHNLRTTEFKLLQAQINPHFLYNTLDTIVWLAEDKQNEQVVEMTTALSDFFRASVSKGRDFITIREEEVHIQSYLKIQQFRYQDILEYKINIPEEIKEYYILKLTLQPLVENALYHGIKSRREKGIIEIEGYCENENIIFKVRDNGSGMTEEVLFKLRCSLTHTTGEEITKGFGLFNVNERIRLHYGEEYGIFIESGPGVGTEVTVIIPAKNNETNSKENTPELG